MKKNLVPAIVALAFAPFFAISAFAETAPEAVPAVDDSAAAKTSTPAGWTDDFNAAKKRAADEGKDLFVLFTGSDWCGWCIRLKDEVFSKAGFIEKLSENFIPVFIDVPNDQSLLSELAKKQNRPLADRYKIQGFPTVLLMDCDGIAFAQTGYLAGGAKKYLENVAKISAEGKASAGYAAKKALADLPQGPDRVKKLDEALASLPVEAQLENIDFIEEILAADPDGKLGYRAKYPFFTVVMPLADELNNALFEFSREAQKIIEESGEKMTEQSARAAFKKVFDKHPDVFPKLKEKALSAQALFPRESVGRKQVDQILTVVDRIIEHATSDNKK